MVSGCVILSIAQTRMQFLLKSVVNRYSSEFDNDRKSSNFILVSKFTGRIQNLR